MEQLYLGLDVGASNIRTGLSSGEEIFEGSRKHVPTEEYWSDEGLYELAEETLESCEVDDEQLGGIGIGVPGLVNPEGEMVYADSLEELDFGSLERLETPYKIENDANVAALGEKEYGNGGEDLASVVIGSGVGAGIIQNGNLLESRNNGESPEPAGVYVGDGESWGVLGGDNLPEYIEERTRGKETSLPRDASAEELFNQEATDEVASEIVDDLAEMNARGIAAIVNLYAPEQVTFSGSVAVENPEFMQDSFERVEKYSVNPVPDMEISRLGNELGLYGALGLARNGF